MAASRRGVRVLIMALIISVCVLLYFEAHATNLLLSEADGARLLADDTVRERDKMKPHVSGLEGGASKVIERAAAIGSPGHEEAHTMGKKFKYHFKVGSLCL